MSFIFEIDLLMTKSMLKNTIVLFIKAPAYWRKIQKSKFNMYTYDFYY